MDNLELLGLAVTGLFAGWLNVMAGGGSLLTVPVMVLIGEDDFVVCGNELDCHDHAAVVASESQFYPPNTCPEVVVLEDTNHNANLHRNAPQVFALMQDWINRRIGSAGEPATEPCSG